MTVTVVRLGQGLPESTHKTATQFVKELPEGHTLVYFCGNDWDLIHYYSFIYEQKTKLNIQLDAKVLDRSRLSTPHRNTDYVVPS